MTSAAGPARLPRSVRLLVAARAVNRLGAFSLPFLTVLLTTDSARAPPPQGTSPQLSGSPRSPPGCSAGGWPTASGGAAPSSPGSPGARRRNWASPPPAACSRRRASPC